MTFYIHYTDDREVHGLSGLPSPDYHNLEVDEKFAMDLIGARTRLSDYVVGYSPKLKKHVIIDKAQINQTTVTNKSYMVERVVEHDPTTEVQVTIKDGRFILDLEGLEENDETRLYFTKKGFELVFHITERNDTRKLISSVRFNFQKAFDDRISEVAVDCGTNVSVVTKKVFKSYSLVVDNGTLL